MRRRRPKDRKDRVHGVAGCTKKERFWCTSGKHWVCVCRGCSGDMPDTCDWCWAKKHGGRVELTSQEVAP